MDADGLLSAQGSHRKRKPSWRRARGVRPQERDGYWHAVGRLRVGGHSVRIRRSLGLAVAATGYEQAAAECESYVEDIKAQLTGKTGRGSPLAIAAHDYLTRERARPLKPTSIVIVKEIVARFGSRRLNEIPTADWKRWIDGEYTEAGFVPGRMTGRKAATRERFLNSVFAFLNFCRRHHRLEQLPVFERDKKARNPNRRARRRVEDLRPDLISILFASAHISIRAQLAVEKCCGARVSSVLFAARLCDLHLAAGREQIVFPTSKNGEPVTAVLDHTTVSILKDYLKWRGRLHEREAPLFLTYRRKPYTDNGGAYGGQNKTGFAAARRRAIGAVLAAGEDSYARLMRMGRRKAAAEAREQAKADAALLGKVTQHWFRHLFATRMQHEPRAAMGQAGWLDIRSFVGYTHDVTESRRALIRSNDDLATIWTRTRRPKAKKSI